MSSSNTNLVNWITYIKLKKTLNQGSQTHLYQVDLAEIEKLYIASIYWIPNIY